MKHVRAAVIGGGIHGVTVSIALAKHNVDVILIDKTEKFFCGTSGATQNRAHLGYHYPRSTATAIECFEGLKVFQERYPQALAYPKEAYYLIDKNASRVSVSEFQAFCDQMDIPYEMRLPSNGFINKDAVAAGFKVPEPVFNVDVLADLIEREARAIGVDIHMGSELVAASRRDSRFTITAEGNATRSEHDVDIVVNATYAYTNNILRILGLDDEMTEYILQTTEVPIAKSQVEVPALTVMDGEFVSVLPYGDRQDYVLVYDVLHSVVHKENGYFYDDSRVHPTNWQKMIEHGRHYYPFMNDLVYIGSLWGARPIPIEASGDERKTRIVAHRGTPGVYSILEGKFISAPLIADRLLEQLRADGVLV